MTEERARIVDCERRLGYAFATPALLTQALTHASARGVSLSRLDNERLEFIGDRVLGLAIAEALCAAEPEAREGVLARRLNLLVRKETCAEVARRAGFGPHLILSASEADHGGRDKDTILADAVEALLGAVFLDGGYEEARGVVRRLWSEELAESAKSPIDAKSALQEWAQRQGWPLPRYTEVERHGPDHKPQFTSEVRIPGKLPAQGVGANKRTAEQAAAAAMLLREGAADATVSHG